MSPAEMRGRPAVAVNPVSKEIRNPLAEEAIVVAAMPTAAAETAAVEIEAAGKRADEEFQWRIK